jgi:hypothetical protein
LTRTIKCKWQDHRESRLQGPYSLSRFIGFTGSEHFNPLSFQSEIQSCLYTWDYLLKPLKEKVIPQADVVIDGRMNDWSGLLTWTFGSNDQVRFGIAQNDDYVLWGWKLRMKM